METAIFKDNVSERDWLTKLLNISKGDIIFIYKSILGYKYIGSDILTVLGVNNDGVLVSTGDDVKYSEIAAIKSKKDKVADKQLKVESARDMLINTHIRTEDEIVDDIAKHLKLCLGNNLTVDDIDDISNILLPVYIRSNFKDIKKWRKLVKLLTIGDRCRINYRKWVEVTATNIDSILNKPDNISHVDFVSFADALQSSMKTILTEKNNK